MNDELKQLIEDAAKLLGYMPCVDPEDGYYSEDRWGLFHFNPLDPERGDLMKVAEAADLRIDFFCEEVVTRDRNYAFGFTKGDHQSLALAILRAASAVLHSRNDGPGEEDGPWAPGWKTRGGV